MFIGCIPAHALYFSSYEFVKAQSPNQEEITPLISSLAGAAATTSHDMIMTPLDTIKQRIQLGHYNASVQTAIREIYFTEGIAAFYRSFPVTLATNVPYGMVMVSTHEWFKHAWMDPDVPAWKTVLAASSVAGCVASAVTTPLDRIKTALQTQQLAPTCLRAQGMCPLQPPVNWRQAAQVIYQQEGAAGFFRGLLPRVMSHTPAVAISWTTYETAKQYLMQNYA